MRLRAFVVLAALLACAGHAAASSFSTLYAFCAKADCRDGAMPNAKLLIDPAGNLYGETFAGGTNGAGTVFRYRRDGGTPVYEAIYSFCPDVGCTTGSGPYDVSGLIRDTAGSLYGTTSIGGANNGGVVFKLTPTAAGNKWTIKLLYSFCAKPSCADGTEPLGGLTYDGASSGAAYDGASPLYGMTEGGGANGGGTVYSLIKGTGPKGNYKHTVLYGFCQKSACADGAQPNWGLVVDTGGQRFYGVTHRGGANGGNGVLFKLGKFQGAWVETVLHTFCASDPCTDGLFPTDLTVDPATGTLYGTMQLSALSGGGGTLFTYTPTGSQFATVHTFCTSPPCADGQAPAGIARDPATGIFYGTTGGGGDHAWGTVFRYAAGSETPLYSFCADAGNSSCADGRVPFPQTVTPDGQGHLFGTTNSGGIHSGNGTLFEIDP